MNPAELYLAVRQKEGRLFGDDEVRRLPSLPEGHPLAEEWRLRTASCARLKDRFERSGRPLAILDLGCGNGWLSGQLARIARATVWGLDRESTELAQAARLFSGHRLRFMAADIFYAPFHRPAFDVLVLASVIQYFPDLPALLATLRLLLRPGGEIHLLDSPLYTPAELPAARQRTQQYYDSLGYPEMAGLYFHHSIGDLAGFPHRWLYNPGGLRNRLSRAAGRPVSPFPWICVGW